MTNTQTLIIGAGPAGLACAACLQHSGLEYLMVEREKQVAPGWRTHYDRLHLHTNKSLSALPFKPFDAALPTYVPRQAVVDYMDQYQQEMGILPIFETEVSAVKKDGDYWIAESNKGVFRAKNVIIATGQTNRPKMAAFEGLESFPGPVLHSSSYKNGKPFAGQHVLVIGFGNSAGEIAIDLHEHGARPALSVRAAVNVLPRDVFGIPVLQLGLLMQYLPPRVADKLNGSLIRFLVGDLNKVGLKKSPLGPLEQIAKEKRIPLLDIGTMKLLRQGHIRAFGGIRAIAGHSVQFEDGRSENFDAIVMATGYANELEKFVHADPVRFQELSLPCAKQAHFGADGLYFCGFHISGTGMLREIGIEARMIAKMILKA